MLELHSVSKMFGSTVAVDSFSLEVSSGEFMALLGPSGCGKTTLIRLIAGLESPDSGKITVNGSNWTKMNPQQRNVAFVFQHFALYPHRTIRGNIEYPLRLRNMSSEERFSKVAHISKYLGLEALLERRPNQLSGGEAQRVALARALVREPSCFLMDEPLSNLDAQLRVRAGAEIKRIQHELNVTGIYVTHDQAEAVALGDRIAIMNNGRLIQVGTPEELFRRPATTFVAAFLGRPPMNLISGTVAASSEGYFSIRLQVIDGPSIVFRGFRGAKLSDRQKVCVGFRPDHVKLGPRNTPDEPSEVTLDGQIEIVEGLEPNVVVHCRTPVGLILAHTSRRMEMGSTTILLQAAQAHIFDGETGNRIE